MLHKGHILLLVGKPQGGKSFFAEQLAISVSSGELFLDTQINQSPVILIDEDTPSDTLQDRIKRLSQGLGVNLKDLPLDIRSMTGFRLSLKKHLEDLQKEVKTKGEVLIILDSLVTITGRALNSTTDAMKTASELKSLRDLNSGVTLLVIHHMSLKKDRALDEYDPSSRVMGNTQLVAQCDTLLELGGLESKPSTRFIARALARRSALGSRFTQPFAVELVEKEGWARLEMLGYIPSDPSKAAKKIFQIFLKADIVDATVDTIIKVVSGDFEQKEVRAALHELNDHRALIQNKAKDKSHRFQYSLHPKFGKGEGVYVDYWNKLKESDDQDSLV